MKCPYCSSHIPNDGSAERAELRTLLGYVSGLLVDYRIGIPPRSEGLAKRCADQLAEKVAAHGIRPKRVFK